MTSGLRRPRSSFRYERREERFHSSQADTFAGANVEGKGVGLLRSK
jgi:hypothetical protein